MTLAMLLNRPCTIIRRRAGSATNEQGDKIMLEQPYDTVCELQQHQRGPNREQTAEGEIARSDWLLILPAHSDLRLGDAVIVDAISYEVDGEPWPARNPRTRTQSHIEATLQRTAAPDDPQGS